MAQAPLHSNTCILKSLTFCSQQVVQVTFGRAQLWAAHRHKPSSLQEVPSIAFAPSPVMFTERWGLTEPAHHSCSTDLIPPLSGPFPTHRSLEQDTLHLSTSTVFPLPYITGMCSQCSHCSAKPDPFTLRYFKNYPSSKAVRYLYATTTLQSPCPGNLGWNGTIAESLLLSDL